MRLIVGLGNPGDRYRGTRHNAGYRVVAALAERAGIALDEARYEGRFGAGHVAGHEVGLLLPETFMNASGEAVAQAVNGLGVGDPPHELLVVIDDLDLSLGRLRLRPDGRDGGQKGLRDIQERLGGEPIPRLRFGIDRPPVGIDPVDLGAAPVRTRRREGAAPGRAARGRRDRLLARGRHRDRDGPLQRPFPRTRRRRMTGLPRAEASGTLRPPR